MEIDANLEHLPQGSVSLFDFYRDGIAPLGVCAVAIVCFNVQIIVVLSLLFDQIID